MRRFRRAGHLACIALFAQLISCSSDASPTAIQSVVNSVVVSLGLSNLTVGQTVQAAAIARDASGGALSGVTIAWASSNNSIVTVTPNGLVTAVSPGSATITGTVGSRSANVNVVVTGGAAAGPVASVAVALSASNLSEGQTATAIATARDANNVEVTERTVTWSSSDTTVATVSGTGAVLAVGVGSAEIVATSEGVSGRAPLTVGTATVASIKVTLGATGISGGATTTATAVVRDEDDNELTREVTWSSSNVVVATITDEGVVTGVTPGSTTISATVDGVTGSATLTVQAPVTLVSVSLAESAISVSMGTRATATLRDGNSNIVTGRVISWSSSNPAVATVSPSGFVTGVGVGSTSITATVDGASGSATLTVSATVTTVSVTLGSSTLGVGSTTTATATVLDGAGNVLTGRTIEWNSSATGLVVVSQAGVVTGVAPGGASIVAKVEGISGTAPITITAAGSNPNPGQDPTATATQLAMLQQPGGAASGSVFGVPAIVEIRGGNNSRIAGRTNAVTATIASGSGTLLGTTTVSAVDGIAVFAALRISGTGPHTLTFSAGPLTPTTSNFFTVAAVPASQLAVITQPSGALSGQAFTTQPEVQLRDANNAIVTSSNAPVTVSIQSGTGTLSGTTTVNATSGVASFANLAISGVGPHVLAFTSPGLTGSSSVSFTVSPIPPTQLAITTQPAGAVTGVNFTTQPVVQVRDAASALVTTSSVPVTASVASGSGTLAGITTVNAVNGVATFTNLRINGSGAHTIRFSSSGLSAATSGSLTVATLPATQLTVTTSPGGAVNGAVFTTQPVVQVRNAGNGVVTTSTDAVTAAITTGSGTLSGTTTVNAVNGIAAFTNLKITGTGPHTISFTSPSLSSASSNVTVSSMPPTQLTITTDPTGATSGTAFTTQPVVQIRDASNAVVTGSSAAVTATIASGTGTLSGTRTVNAVNGVVTFGNLRISGTGAHTLIFTSTGLTSATSASFTVAAAPATQLTVTTQPSGATSGALFTTQPLVQIRDAANAVVGTSTAAVTVAIATGTGTLSGTTTVNAVNGVASFTNLRITGTGAFTLGFTSAGLTPATSSIMTVSATPPTQLTIATQPSGAASGTAFTTQPVVQLRDAANAVVTGSTAAVTVSVASGSGTLLGTTTVNAVNGIATFANLSISGTGSHTLTFASTGLTSATSSAFTVAASPPTQLAVTTQPSGAASGAAFTTQPVVQIRDAANAVVTTSTASVTVAIASGSGTLSGTTTVNAVNGVATFTNLAVTGSGAHTLRFTSTGLAQATSGSFTLGGASPTQVVITTQPAGAVSGVNLTTQPVVQLRDAAGNLTSSNAQVGVTIANGSGTLVGTAIVNAVNGVATFSGLRINGAGAHTLMFGSVGLPTVNSASINVTQTPASLSIQTQPDGAVSGSALTTQPVVRILDNAGLLIANSALAVTATRTTGTGSLFGATTVNASGGVATFSTLRVDGAGSHALTFSTSSPALQVASAAFNVALAANGGTYLAITAQPTNVGTGAAISPVVIVQVRDANNVLVPTSNASVTATISVGGTLTGTTTVSAVAGIATFANLRPAGSGSLRLTFASTGLTSAVSDVFSVVAGGGSTTIFTHNFDDGTSGPFPTNVAPGVNLTFPNDPTGSGRGKVFSIRYADPGPNADINRYLDPVPPASITYGSTFYFGGDLYFPNGTANFTNSSVQRKLLYLRNDNPANPLIYVTLRLYGNRPSIEWVYKGSAAASRSTDFAGVNLAMGQWHRIEVQVKCESAPGVADGLIRVWVNGVMVYEYLNNSFTATGETKPLRFNRWWVGAQREGSDNSGGATELNIDETRYWDNITFSTVRVGPWP